MPLVRIDLVEGRSAPQVAAISNAIQRALVDCLDVPERDQFQVINEHSPGRLIYNSGYLGVERTEGIVIVQIFLSSGRSTAQKRRFMLAQPSFSPRKRRHGRKMSRSC